MGGGAGGPKILVCYFTHSEYTRANFSLDEPVMKVLHSESCSTRAGWSSRTYIKNIIARLRRDSQWTVGYYCVRAH